MKKKIAVLFGGRSSEYHISLASAYSVLSALDSRCYDIVPVGISQNGDWFHYLGTFEKIRDNTWFQERSALIPAAVSPNPSTHGLVEFTRNENLITRLDYAFPVLHGRNGEDGTIQGLFELAGIPVIGCGTLSSALCMDKHRAHQIVQAAGIAVPKSVMFPACERGHVSELTDGMRYPLFVKPLRAGSSFGISKVEEPSGLPDAVETALQFDDQVTVEEMVEGFEIGCAVMGIHDLKVGRVDEVVLTHGFHDYDTKYLKDSVVHLPARMDTVTEQQVQETAKNVYQALGCSGFARVDLFLTPDGTLVFNEVNTIPGMTVRSRFPAMMQAAGLEFPELLKELIGMYEE